MAQSSVTLFGVVDMAVQVGRGSVSDRTQLVSGSNASSRLGFRGVEDLGGGMSASFWLEGQLSADNGAGASTNTNNQIAGATPVGGLTFNRRSTVSLSNALGELRIGRDYTPQFWNVNIADPFGSLGVGASQTVVAVTPMPTSARASNSIGYFLPATLGGVYGQAQYYLGENPSGSATSEDGRGAALRVGYKSGPFDGAVATSNTKYASGDFRQDNAFAAWDFSVLRIVGQYSWDKLGAVDGRGWLLGATVPVGVGQIKLAYSRYKNSPAVGPKPETSKLALGYIYNLSKRTALYAHAARVSNDGGAATAIGGAVTAPNRSSSAYELGIRTTF